MDGPAAQATFRWPIGVLVDSEGNIYVADTNNHTIRKITPDGEVITIAGLAGESGSADGQGSNARFSYPRDLAFDSARNLCVAQAWNHGIRKITPEGEVTTWVGSNEESGFTDGSGNEARFDSPRGIDVDDADNVYVADQRNGAIRRITPEGEVSQVAGISGGIEDGVVAEARFFEPHGVAVDNAGALYVADSGNHTIRKIDGGLQVTTVAGHPGFPGSQDGTGDQARFSEPIDLAAGQESNLYVADRKNHTIRTSDFGRCGVHGGWPGRNIGPRRWGAK